MLTVYHEWTHVPNTFLNLSKVPASTLIEEIDALVQHQKPCSVYLGHLEPGWMLDPKHEIRMRKFLRTFDVHMICFFLESIPFSWKNETGTIYRKTSQPNGDAQTLHDGRSDHDQSPPQYGQTS
jgi:hypothetical protein